MFDIDSTTNSLHWNFNGKSLLTGETDGSSLPNGGLRHTHQAGGYLIADPTSQIFLREDTVFIPSCFLSYNGKALDEKISLLRAIDALSREGKRYMLDLMMMMAAVMMMIAMIRMLMALLVMMMLTMTTKRV